MGRGRSDVEYGGFQVKRGGEKEEVHQMWELLEVNWCTSLLGNTRRGSVGPLGTESILASSSLRKSYMQ